MGSRGENGDERGARSCDVQAGELRVLAGASGDSAPPGAGEERLAAAALELVAAGVARKVARVREMQARQAALDEQQDVRACVLSRAHPSNDQGDRDALAALLDRTSLTDGQRRYIEGLYASDPGLRGAIDDVLSFGLSSGPRGEEHRPDGTAKVCHLLRARRRHGLQGAR